MVRLAAVAGELDHPADGQRGGTAGTNLDGHLVGGTTDAAAAHLELGRTLSSARLSAATGSSPVFSCTISSAS